MAQFGVQEVRPAASTTLGSNSTKTAAPVSTSYQTVYTITLTPQSDERVELGTVTADAAANQGAGSSTLQLGASIQEGSGAEGATLDGQTLGVSALSNNWTSDTFNNLSVLGTNGYLGPVGVPVTVRVKLKTSSAVNTTAMGLRNGVVPGRIVKVIHQAMGGQFRGSF